MASMVTAAKRFKRLVLSQRQLFGTVAFFTSIMVVFLILWSALDAPKSEGEYTLTDETTEDGEYIVIVGYFCSSHSDVWRYVAVGWHCILLICATVLAFQTRNLQAGFSESHVLAIMTYAHFVFVMLRVFSFLLEETVSASYMAAVLSLIYSADAIVTLCVYFVPKLLQDDDKFFALTHQPNTSSSKHGRGSVVTMGPSVVIQNGTAPSSKPFADDSEASSSGDPETPRLNNRSGRTPAQKNESKGDVLKTKVSWAGLNFSEWVGSKPESDEDSEGSTEELDQIDRDGQEERTPFQKQEQEKTPFQKPVDVLKGNRDSWGGGHMTIMIRDEDDNSSANGEDAGHGALKPIAESTSEGTSHTKAQRKSLLQPASLPSVGSSRFNYASSRINRTRNRHTASNPDIDGSFHDEDSTAHEPK
jgi:7 transmembrane sweet-taste receptor of 3 GCPR